MAVIATFEIRKTKSSPFGRIEVREPDKDTPYHYGLHYYIGQYDRGYTPVRAEFGKLVAIGLAARLAPRFAKQNGCKWVYRADSQRPLRKVV